MSQESLTHEEERRHWLDNPGILSRHERVWRSRQNWLEERGYMLRSRYKPDWVPSWSGTGKWYNNCVDGPGNPNGLRVIDATRISDGSFVMLKRVKADNLSELEIIRFLSSEPLASDPRNHCTPLLDVLPLPDPQDGVLVVTHMLRPLDNPRFETIGEAVAFFSQIFVVRSSPVHNLLDAVLIVDCTSGNIMMEPVMFPNPYHPVKIERRRDWKGRTPYYTRTECPPRYFFIDFGLSIRYPSADGPHLELPIRGGDKTAPEHTGANYMIPCDPFATDIYYLGNLIRETFIQKCYGFRVIEPLVADMVQEEPSKRPKIDEVVRRFELIRKSLSWLKLRSRIRKRKEITPVRFWRACIHIYHNALYLATRTPAIPDA
ncbi:uncharacterized protein STEHIDRAFT_155287 [Stereum hirsutum FP-91666 SS1]|uniref:uncharacterized protein n=1 Tax=Stereum hirsutum (strain FP-91666) TaxID=721885 RepID=UPI00044100E0|nr:uncharacterized protein STEHIDRAFT_155287 [Stereum hirsutum FP-91666 SS1]EIM87928.1 hypothetical protein STEHIDRAFT_155287 [Stereum hirsutum FP-91666 SS1]